MSCDQRSERTDEFSEAKPSVRSVGYTFSISLLKKSLIPNKYALKEKSSYER